MLYQEVTGLPSLILITRLVTPTVTFSLRRMYINAIEAFYGSFFPALCPCFESLVSGDRVGPT